LSAGVADGPGRRGSRDPGGAHRLAVGAGPVSGPALAEAGMTLSAGPDIATMLQAFFRHLNASGLPYVVVGDVRDLPHDVRGDVDFVVPRHRLGAVHGIIRVFAQAQDVDLVQVLQHEASAYYTCLGWVGPRGYCVLKL